jgi:Fe-Mn family superoxide dismutase
MKSFSKVADQTAHSFILTDLPYGENDLSPHLTKETFDYHHKKHHKAYVDNLNKLLNDSLNDELKAKTLEEIIILAKQGKQDAIFNNAAQVWNHSFYWHCMKPNGGGTPKDELLQQIEKDFGSFEEFVTQFKTMGLSQFGSGWVWLVANKEGLKIVKTANAEIPITENYFPIITCDVWEHAYYIDYKNSRANYLDTFFDHLVNWDFAAKNYTNSLQ